MMTADIFLHPFDEVSPEGAIGFFSISLGLYLAGLMLRRHGIKQKIAEKKQQMARIENENSRLHRDNMLAIRLHDSIAGGVSSIALASSLHDPDDEVLREIHHDAVTVLERIHEILALLADREGRWRENSVPKVPLQEVIQNIDMSLNSLGFRGKTEITLNEVVFDSELGALLEDFLMEIRQNIERHSSMKGGDYAMSVRVEGDEVLIRQTNPISDETASLVPSELSTHKGLMLYKQRIESMGGSLEYEVSDSTWFLFASLPLHKI
jgi:glucose-6-phosphate-specific signal transduction histidine kinase